MVATAKEGRLANGYFAKGNKHSPGMSHTMKRLHQFFSLVTEEHIEAVYNRVLQLCLHSDNDKVSLAACEIYLNRVCGKVKEEIEINSVPTQLTHDEAMAKLRELMNNESKPAPIKEITAA